MIRKQYKQKYTIFKVLTIKYQGKMDLNGPTFSKYILCYIIVIK